MPRDREYFYALHDPNRALAGFVVSAESGRRHRVEDEVTKKACARRDAPGKKSNLRTRQGVACDADLEAVAGPAAAAVVNRVWRDSVNAPGPGPNGRRRLGNR